MRGPIIGKGPKAGQDRGPVLHIPGKTAYLAGFIGAFVSHTEADARDAAEYWASLKVAPVGIYKVTLQEIVQPGDAPAPFAGGAEASERA